MSEQQEQEYRLAAAECLEAANFTHDQRLRTQLLIIAQKWLERANAVFARRDTPRAPSAADDSHLR
jgi:hypothetical protein